MTLAGLAARNVLRNKFRAILTVLGVAIAIIAFLLLRTVLSAWTVAADYAAKDRVVTRHKVSFIISLPKRYIDTVREVPGVTGATYANWFGAKDPNRPNEYFATIAVDPDSFFEVYDELEVSEEHLAAFKEHRQGAIIGDLLAKRAGWKVGDKITLQGSIYPGNWDFHIRGIYTSQSKSMDRSQLLFHWDYLNQSIPEGRQDEIGWIVSRVKNPADSAAIGKRIDRIFEEQDVQTLSMSERAFNLSFLAMVSAILDAIDIVSIIILFILLLLLGNTIAMGVRERTNEYGVLRALGFLPRHIALFVLGESITLGVLAGIVGVAIGWPLVELGMGRFIEENLGSFFPYFRVDPATAVLAFFLAILLAVVAAAIPARRASRLTVTDALRRVG